VLIRRLLVKLNFFAGCPAYLHDALVFMNTQQLRDDRLFRLYISSSFLRLAHRCHNFANELVKTFLDELCVTAKGANPQQSIPMRRAQGRLSKAVDVRDEFEREPKNSAW
jgi:hypothetical protein